ncbi:LLM class flavin-dependent oxidoreductase [Streptosporangium carneum]|uniref:Monooxygenase n=1 Tax=Streptosporangium carneum TaxID=47481 RepID=A0A9W6MC77_9ACTN|nr:LLM class flavin-dependent oxidoreductase [Streptosporangium carneum]GLK08443.1 putative monooxygenase [Streptosporangium carneum]
MDKRLSIMLPLMAATPEQLRPFLTLVSETPATRLWTGQSLTIDHLMALAFLAGRGLRVPIGTGVNVMPLKHPYQTAVDFRTLALLLGQPVTAGLGLGHRQVQRALTGRTYAGQLDAAREYLRVLRSLLSGSPVDADGRYFPMTGRMTRLQHPPVEIGAGVLRPGMAQVAAETADAAITWLVPLEYLSEEILPVLTAKAAEAGRPRPRVVAIVPLVLDRPGRDTVEIAGLATASRVRADHYADMLRKAGIAAGPHESAQLVKELMARNVVLSGGARDVRGTLESYWRAGVDEVVLDTTGVVRKHGIRQARNDLEEVVLTHFGK